MAHIYVRGLTYVCVIGGWLVRLIVENRPPPMPVSTIPTTTTPAHYPKKLRAIFHYVIVRFVIV